jgi:hypothetical protein
MLCGREWGKYVKKEEREREREIARLSGGGE